MSRAGSAVQASRIAPSLILTFVAAVIVSMPALARANPAKPLVDRALARGVDTPHVQRGHRLRGLADTLGAGACVFDANRDMLPDLLVLGGEGPKRHYGLDAWWAREHPTVLYINQGQGFFDGRALGGQTGGAAIANTQACAAGDLDNDGDPDLVITAKGKNQLWRNRGDGSFVRVTDSALTRGASWTTDVTLLDLDGDGWLDVYVGGFIRYEQNERVFESYSGYVKRLRSTFKPDRFQPVQSRLYRNGGGWQFEDITEASGMATAVGRTIAAYRFDANADGRPDLLELNTAQHEHNVWINRGHGKFERSGSDQTIVPTDAVESIAIADLNGNTEADMVYGTAAREPIRLAYDVAESARADASVMVDGTLGWNARAVALADLDGDATVDAVFGNGFLRPHANAPGVPLGQRMGLVWGVGSTGRSGREVGQVGSVQSTRSLARGDFDNDGDVDFFASHNNALGSLYFDPSKPEPDWLQVLAVDGEGHVGHARRITVETDRGRRSWFGGSPQRALGHGGRRAHFSLADGASVERIEVVWPNGRRTHHTGVAKGAVYRVTVAGQTSRMRPPTQAGNGPHEADSQHRGQAREVHQLRESVLEPSQSASAKPFPRLMRPPIDDAVYWLIEGLQRGVNRCRIAATLEHYYKQTRIVTRTKDIAVNHLAKAVGSAPPEAKVCLLSALAESDAYRAFGAIAAQIDQVDVRVRRAAVRALGQLGDGRGLDLLAAATARAPVGIVAEAIVSAEQIEPGAGVAMGRRRMEAADSRTRSKLWQALDQTVRDRAVSNRLLMWLRAQQAAS